MTCRRPSAAELELLLGELERVARHPATKIPTATIVRLAIALPRRLGELCDMRWAVLRRYTYLSAEALSEKLGESNAGQPQAPEADSKPA